jgi:uncharacterized protein
MKLVKLFFLVIIILIKSTLFAQTQIEKGEIFINYLFKEKDFAKAIEMLSLYAKSKISESELKLSVSQIETSLGKFTKVIEVNQEKNIYFFNTKFENTSYDINIIFDSLNLISTFQLKSHRNFDKSKKDFIIPNGNYPLIGSLEQPLLVNKEILVIFIHGSGPNDRDETFQQNKPFKDIAIGLSENGISSYRFDKKTLTYPSFFSDKNMDIDNEVCNDIYSIVSFFRNDSIFKNYKIVLIGHSLGAMLLPRIADSLKTTINAMVMLAAPAYKFENLILTQFKYLYELNQSEELKNEIEKLKKSITFLHSTQFNIQSLNDSLPLKMPAVYWKSILEYDQIKIAKRISIPTLIIQPERDYQVDKSNYLQWKKVLKGKKNYFYKSYLNLNHLFLEGQGKSTPSEYLKKQNVPQYFIDDLSNWLLYNKL